MTITMGLTVEERLEHLEKLVAQTGLGYGQFFPGSLLIVPADADGDKTFEPYTSTSWDGDAFSTGTGTINWNTVFGVPPQAKMVFLRLLIKDEASTGGIYYFQLKAKSGGTEYPLTAYAARGVNDELSSANGWVPIAQNGTSYYNIVASSASAMDIRIWVTAYAR